MINGLYDWLDDRLNISDGGRKMVNKIFPDHWSFMIGEIALYSFVILLRDGHLPHAVLRALLRDAIYHRSLTCRSTA